MNLWRPFSDAPPVVVPQAAPVTVKLFSVMRRDGVLVAALDLGGADGLVYAKPGDAVGQVQVLGVDAAGAEISLGGRKLRLEVGQ